MGRQKPAASRCDHVQVLPLRLVSRSHTFIWTNDTLKWIPYCLYDVTVWASPIRLYRDKIVLVTLSDGLVQTKVQ